MEVARISAGLLPWPMVKHKAIRYNGHCGIARVDGMTNGLEGQRHGA